MTIPDKKSWHDVMSEELKSLNFIDGDIEVAFFGLREKLIDFIRGSEVIVGCVAWISDKDIIDTLAAHKNFSLIVAKGNIPGCHGTHRLRNLAHCLKGAGLSPTYVPDLYYYLDESGQEISALDVVRCAGYAQDNTGTVPLLHHKFLVRCTRTSVCTPQLTSPDVLHAEAVWTGSFNFTTPAAESHFENAIIIRRPQVAEAYRKAWESVYRWSEPLSTRNPSLTEMKFNDDLIPGTEDYL